MTRIVQIAVAKSRGFSTIICLDENGRAWQLGTTDEWLRLPPIPKCVCMDGADTGKMKGCAVHRFGL